MPIGFVLLNRTAILPGKNWTDSSSVPDIQKRLLSGGVFSVDLDVVV